MDDLTWNISIAPWTLAAYRQPHADNNNTPTSFLAVRTEEPAISLGFEPVFNLDETAESLQSWTRAPELGPSRHVKYKYKYIPQKERFCQFQQLRLTMTSQAQDVAAKMLGSLFVQVGGSCPSLYTVNSSNTCLRNDTLKQRHVPLKPAWVQHHCICTSYEPVSQALDEPVLTPMPRNTLTALEPVTLPMDASAYWSWVAATLLAKVSERSEGGVRDQIFPVWAIANSLNTHSTQQMRVERTNINVII